MINNKQQTPISTTPAPSNYGPITSRGKTTASKKETRENSIKLDYSAFTGNRIILTPVQISPFIQSCTASLDSKQRSVRTKLKLAKTPPNVQDNSICVCLCMPHARDCTQTVQTHTQTHILTLH